MTRKHVKSAIIGMVLGDGHLGRGITPEGTYRNKVYLDIGHSIKQREYLEWKKGIIQRLFKYPIKINFKTIKNKKTGNTYPICWLRTKVHPRLTQIYKLTYRNRRKTITERSLSYVDDLGLAIWFMDDGSLHKNPKGGWIVCLATHSFSREENQLIQNWLLKKYGINLNCYQHKSGTWYLKRGISEGHKVLEVVRPYVEQVPCMRYKVSYQMKRSLYTLSGNYTKNSTQHPITQDDDIVHT